jgi:preprotein translocase subunit YajC
MRVFFFQITQHAMSKMSSLFSSSFFAQAAAPAGPQQGGGIPGVMIIGYLLLFAAMYFFMIAPQRKKQKAHEKMLSALQSGDEIITNGGIYGVITNVKDDRFVVRIADNTKIEVGKGFVQTVLRKPEPAEKK